MNAKLFKANFMKISCYFNRKSIGKDCKKRLYLLCCNFILDNEFLLLLDT